MCVLLIKLADDGAKSFQQVCQPSRQAAPRSTKLCVAVMRAEFSNSGVLKVFANFQVTYFPELTACSNSVELCQMARKKDGNIRK